MLRIAVVAFILIGAALAAPAVAPDLLARFVGGEPAVAVTASRAEVAPVAREQPALSSGRRAVIEADGQGHYRTEASLNGRPIEILVDTGATTVALTADAARRIGIYPAASEFRLAAMTANGPVTVAPVVIDEIRIGNILARNVEGIVMPAGALDVNLLGMSFLSRLSGFSAQGGTFVMAE